MDKLSRRDVLVRGAALGGGAAAFGAIAVAPVLADAPATPAPAAPAIVWANVGPLPDMKVNDVQRIEIPDSPTHEIVYVRRASDKDYAAFSARCTHRGCVVGIHDASSTTFTCPCHGGQFDNKGNVIQAPPRKPLIALAVKFDDKKNLWIQTPPSPAPKSEHHDGSPTPPPAGLPQ